MKRATEFNFIAQIRWECETSTLGPGDALEIQHIVLEFTGFDQSCRWHAEPEVMPKIMRNQGN
jgi:hypothetical protein